MYERIQKLEDLLNRYKHKRSNIINRFLWSCAGVNTDIINQCPNEYAKYAGVGGTILFTALMAMLSGGYAMFFIFNSVIASVLFGIFWGLLIFNLDRYIVNSMYVDNSPYLNWTKLKLAAPRLVMAVFLGIVISTPLEMKIFSDKIDTQLIQDNITRKTEVKQSSGDYTILKDLQSLQDKLLKERAELNNRSLKAEEELRLEAEGKSLSGKVGHGPMYEDKKQYAERCQEALKQWDANNQSQLKIIQSRISNLSTTIINNESQVDKTYDDGFIARYEAFSNLKSDNSTLAIISWMITLLFITIEMIPTFFKLIMEHGLYDKLCDAEDDIQEKLVIRKYQEIEQIIDDIKKNEDDLLERTRIQHQNEMTIQEQKSQIEQNILSLSAKETELSHKQNELERTASEFDNYKDSMNQALSEKDAEIESLKQHISEQNKNNLRLTLELKRKTGKKKLKFAY